MKEDDDEKPGGAEIKGKEAREGVGKEVPRVRPERENLGGGTAESKQIPELTTPPPPFPPMTQGTSTK